MLCSYTYYFFFFSMLPPPLRSTLFPYTTLFRSTCSARSVVAYVADDSTPMPFSAATSKLSVCVHADREDRKSTRLNSSHRTISYAVFCLKKKKKKHILTKTYQHLLL